MAFSMSTPMLTNFLLASTAMQAAGSIIEGRNQQISAKFNAELAQRQAEAYGKQAELEKYRIERRKRQLMGKQRALYAKAGVRLEGSPLEVLADTEAQFELDKAIVEYNKRLNVGRYKAQASMYKKMGKQALMSGIIKAGTTLLTSFAAMSPNAPAYGSFEYYKQRGQASLPPYDVSYLKP